VLLVTACSEEQLNWPANGTVLKAGKYRLQASDSSRILFRDGQGFSLLSPPDSLLVNKFDIKYSAIGHETNAYFQDRANQMVINTSRPGVIEYYGFNDGDVLFLGYSNANEQKPFTCFEPPLIISSSEIDEFIESSGVMKTYIKADGTFDIGENTTMLIKRIGQVNLNTGHNKNKPCLVSEFILSSDATVAYGDKKLIVPGAISLSTKLLVDINGFPIAEWRLMSTSNDNSDENQQKQKRELFIEFTKYNRKTE